MKLSDYNFISIEGNIGAGKTSLATRIASDYNAKLILEQFEDNSFLPVRTCPTILFRCTKNCLKS
jgi:deoxyadenosine/deoxycytidine kinase